MPTTGKFSLRVSDAMEVGLVGEAEGEPHVDLQLPLVPALIRGSRADDQLVKVDLHVGIVLDEVSPVAARLLESGPG